MKDSSYYTLHLEMHKLSNEPMPEFYPKETQLHHFTTPDNAIVRLFAEQTYHLEKDVIFKNSVDLDYYLERAFVTGPDDDKILAEIKQSQLPNESAGRSRWVVDMKEATELLSSNTHLFFLNSGIDLSHDNIIPITSYDTNGKLLDLFNQESKLRFDIERVFKKEPFAFEVESEKLLLPSPDDRYGPLTKSYHYEKEFRDCMPHLFNYDMQQFNRAIAVEKGYEAVTHSARVFGPFQQPLMVDIYDLSLPKSKYEGFHYDGVYLGIAHENANMTKRSFPEILELPVAGIAATRIIGTYESEGKTLKYADAFHSIKEKLNIDSDLLERRRIKSTRTVPGAESPPGKKLT